MLSTFSRCITTSVLFLAALPSQANAQTNCETLLAQSVFADYKAQQARDAAQAFSNGEYYSRKYVIEENYKSALNSCWGGSGSQCGADAYYEYLRQLDDLDAERQQYEDDVVTTQLEYGAAYAAASNAGCT